MFSVNQIWDPLKVCIIGRAYPPEFFSFIADKKTRSIMERIAIETEEDFQKLKTILESFGVEVLRPNIGSREEHMDGSKLQPPPVMPRDYTAMIGERFFIDRIPGVFNHYSDICDRITAEGNTTSFDTGINSATTITLGKHLYTTGPISDPWDRDIWQVIKKPSWPDDIPEEHLYRLPAAIKYHPKVLEFRKTQINSYHDKVRKMFPEHHVKCYDLNAHIDGCFCPIRPGLLISLRDIQDHELTFPGWDVIYQDDSKLASRLEFNDLRAKNNGKWWLPDVEVDDNFIRFVDTYLDKWTGFVEESVFDVNILMIDQDNAVCSNFNDITLEAMHRHGVNPIKVDFRHRYFWDGGIHCITSDIHRIGDKIDLGLPILP